jgi:hypothetical protein
MASHSLARHSHGKTWESPEHLQDPAAITQLKYSGDSTAEALKQWGKANGSPYDREHVACQGQRTPPLPRNFIRRLLRDMPTNPKPTHRRALVRMP